MTASLHIVQLVSVDELRDDKEFEDIYQDVQDECGKYGKAKFSQDCLTLL
jgi:splicing factor U2AF subunit